MYRIALFMAIALLAQTAYAQRCNVQQPDTASASAAAAQAEITASIQRLNARIDRLASAPVASSSAAGGAASAAASGGNAAEIAALRREARRLGSGGRLGAALLPPYGNGAVSRASSRVDRNGNVRSRSFSKG